MQPQQAPGGVVLGAQALKPPPVSPWVRGLLVAPRCFALLVLATSGMLTMVSVPHFDLSTPDGGLRLRDDPTAERADGFIQAVRERIDGITGDARQERQTQPVWTITLLYRSVAYQDDDRLGSTLLTPDGFASMNALEETIQNETRYSQFCTRAPGTDSCAEMRSLTRLLYEDTLLPRGDLGQDRIDLAFLRAAVSNDEPYGKQDEMAFFLTAEAEEGFSPLTYADVRAERLFPPSLRLTRTELSFGLPLEGYSSIKDRVEEQAELFYGYAQELLELLTALTYVEQVDGAPSREVKPGAYRRVPRSYGSNSDPAARRLQRGGRGPGGTGTGGGGTGPLSDSDANGNPVPTSPPAQVEALDAIDDPIIEVLWFGDGISLIEALMIMSDDLLLSIFAVAAVTLVSWSHTGSLTLAILGVVQVMLSFPVCFFVYRFIFGVKLFGVLQAVALFLLLGLGADDTFIAFDAVEQSALVPVVNTRMDWRIDWALRRAFGAMFTTSVTTMLAFGATTLSVIPMVRYFGVFAAILVVCNLVLVMTFYVAGLAIYFGVRDRPAGMPLWRALFGFVPIDADVGTRTPNAAAADVEMVGTQHKRPRAQVPVVSSGTGPVAPDGGGGGGGHARVLEAGDERAVGERVMDPLPAVDTGGGQRGGGGGDESAAATPQHVADARRRLDSRSASSDGVVAPSDGMDMASTGVSHVFVGAMLPGMLPSVSASAQGSVGGGTASSVAITVGRGIGAAADAIATGYTAPLRSMPARTHRDSADEGADLVDNDAEDEGRVDRVGSYDVGAAPTHFGLDDHDAAAVATAERRSGVGDSQSGTGIEAASAQQKRVDGTVSSDVPKLRRTERFLSDVLAPFIIKRHEPILTIAIVQLVVCVYYATMLEPAQQQLTYLPEEHRISRYLDLTDVMAEETRPVVAVRVVWGVAGVNRSGTDPTALDDFGAPVYDTGFDPRDGDAQEYMAAFCDAVELEENAAALRMRHGESQCLMRSVRDWRIGRQEAWPIPGPKFADAVTEFLSRYKYARKFYLQVGFDDDTDEVLWIWDTYNTTADWEGGMDERRQLQSAWESFTADQVTALNAPQSASGGYATTEWYFVFGRTQELFLSSAFGTLGSSFPLAFVVLVIMTGNWIIAGLATATICGIAATVLGIMGFMGWSLGSIESLCVILLVGSAVDYTVHLGIALNEDPDVDGIEVPDVTKAAPAWGSDAASASVAGPSYAATMHGNVIDGDASATDEGSSDEISVAAEQRARKVRHALMTTGVSVVGGAISTFSAAFVLLFSTITFFSKFATFFTALVVVSLVYAVFVFMALAAVWAPLGNAGSTKAAVRKLMQTMKRGTIAPASHPRREHDDADKGARRRGYAALAVMSVACIVLLVAGPLLVAQAEAEAAAEADKAVAPLDDFRHMPAASTMTDPGEWYELRPGGATSCALGSTYAFYYRPAANPEHADKLVVELQGGGACWSQETCAAASGTFRMDLADLRAEFAGERTSQFNVGVRDYENEDNPVAGWGHLFISYCTGDIHWGDSIVRYSDDLTVRHKGAVNAGAAMDWAASELSLSKVFVTGCSAGAYGSVMWAARAMRAWPDARVYHLADGGVGVVTADFMHDSFLAWNATSVFPFELLGARESDVDVPNLVTQDFYRWITASEAADFDEDHGGGKRIVMSQFNSAYDDNQAFFMKTMRQNEASDVHFSDQLQWAIEATALYEVDVGDAKRFVSSGDHHCVIPYKRYFDASVGDVTLTGWLSDMLADVAVSDVDCASNSSWAAVGSDGELPCRVGVDIRENS